MDDLICPHCDQKIEELSRTGEKRYPCGNCSKVVKYDLIEPYLEQDAVDVIDKRDSMGDSGSDSGDSNNSGESDSSDDSSTEDQNPAMSEKGTLNDREIIKEKGEVGLKQVKKRKLKEWLQSTDGVGPKTLNRIVMVFEEEDMYSEQPETLFSLIDSEISASSTYINTIVNSVFSPEYDHADLLEEQGYEPTFGGSNQNMTQQQPNRGGGMQGNNTNQQFNQQGQQQQQARQNQQQTQPQQQQPQQQQQGMSRQEAVEMIKAMQDDGSEDGSRRRGPATEAVDQATEEAIKNMAQNAGGFFGMMQELAETTLKSYFQKHPEKLVENMDLLQTFMESDDNTSSQGGQNNTAKSEEDQKIDSALDDIREQQGLERQNTQSASQSLDPVQDNSAFRQPGEASNQQQSGQSQEATTDGGSGFEPDPEVLSGGGPEPTPQPEETEQSTEVTTVDEDQDTTENNNQNDQNEQSTTDDSEEEDWFDQAFDEVDATG